MKLFCKQCKIQISNNLIKLEDKNLLNENDGEDYIPQGYYIIDDGDYYSTEGNLIINIKDIINTERHSDKSRLNGCCGLDGLDGLNIVCINNHELGTEKSDCWMAKCICIEPDLVEMK